jgi:hypothetical protein
MRRGFAYFHGALAMVPCGCDQSKALPNSTFKHPVHDLALNPKTQKRNIAGGVLQIQQAAECS